MGSVPAGDDPPEHAHAPGGFERASATLTAAVGARDDLCGPFLDVVPVAGAVISTLGDPLGSQTVCASSPLAARIDEIQMDFGEGPCWSAMRTNRPVLTEDLQDAGGDDWPGAMSALRELRVGSLFAFPLAVGTLALGSVDLYAMSVLRLPPSQVRGISSLAAIAARHVLRRALDALTDAEGQMPAEPYSRREIHQASGMVAAQLSIGVDDALLLLRGRAFSDGRSVREVAADVVGRRLDFRAQSRD